MVRKNMKKDDKKINEFIEKIENKSYEIKKRGVKKIGIFGSFLKGEQKKDSDVDILVSFENANYNSYFEMLVFLRKLLKKKIDLVISESLRPELNYVKKEARYARL